MNDRLSIIFDLLSAGVITSMIAGLFSLIISIKNNKRLIQIENSKQKFVLTQERYKEIKGAYTELLDKLPEEKLLGYVINNSFVGKYPQENGIADFYELSDVNAKIIYSHFQKYGYLLSNNEQNDIIDLVEKIDDISKRIIEINIGLDVYDINVDDEKSMENLQNNIPDRIIKVVELEEKYYHIFKNNLHELLK